MVQFPPIPAGSDELHLRHERINNGEQNACVWALARSPLIPRHVDAADAQVWRTLKASDARFFRAGSGPRKWDPSRRQSRAGILFG